MIFYIMLQDQDLRFYLRTRTFLVPDSRISIPFGKVKSNFIPEVTRQWVFKFQMSFPQRVIQVILLNLHESLRASS